MKHAKMKLNLSKLQILQVYAQKHVSATSQWSLKYLNFRPIHNEEIDLSL